jgi:PAS domain-containing protein
MPISVHDRTGRVVFYNASAETVFGLEFAETGELSATEWTTRVSPTEADGTPIPLEELPIGVALRERRAAHRTVHFTRPDDVDYAAEVTAFPLMGREEELVGGVRIFWNEASLPRAPVAGAHFAEQERASHRGPLSLVLILAREFAANLATPVYVADSNGVVVYFNESAEKVGGRSFAEAGQMSIRQWTLLLRPRRIDGAPLERRDMPGGVAFIERRPAHAQMLISALDGVDRAIAITAFPLFGPDEAFHGIMVIFWPLD